MSQEEIILTKSELLRLINLLLKECVWPQCAAKDVEQIKNSAGETSLRVTQWRGTPPQDPNLVNTMVLSELNRILIRDDDDIACDSHLGEDWRPSQCTPWRSNTWSKPS